MTRISVVVGGLVVVIEVEVVCIAESMLSPLNPPNACEVDVEDCAAAAASVAA
jgi:hypothetical protein